MTAFFHPIRGAVEKPSTSVRVVARTATIVHKYANEINLIILAMRLLVILYGADVGTVLMRMEIQRNKRKTQSSNDFINTKSVFIAILSFVYNVVLYHFEIRTMVRAEQ